MREVSGIIKSRMTKADTVSALAGMSGSSDLYVDTGLAIDGNACAADGKKVLAWAAGRIDNLPELDMRVASAGHRLTGDLPIECLAPLFSELGTSAFAEMNGLFAAVFYDRRAKKVYLVRDMLGRRQLYYLSDGQSLVFSSSLDMLKRHPGFSGEINREIIPSFLAFQFVPAPYTIYRGAYKLMPGCYIEYDLASKTFSEHSYVKPFDQGVYSEAGSYDTAVVALRERISDAVSKNIGDRRVGVLLSGGVDSAIIAALASEHASRRDAQIQVFSMGQEDPLYDESVMSLYSATEIGKRHRNLRYRTVKVRCPDFKDMCGMICKCGEPFGDASLIACRQLGDFIGNDVDVVLGGDGADELFGGYERYVAMSFWKAIHFPFRYLPKAVRSRLACLVPNGHERSTSGRLHRFVDILGDDFEHAYLKLVSHLDDNCHRLLFGDRLADTVYGSFSKIEERIGRSDGTDFCAKYDIDSYLPNDIFRKLDLAFGGIDYRSPFLDREVYDFSMALPWRYKQSGFSRKCILRDAFEGLVPEKIMNSPKRGFGVPIDKYIREWRAGLIGLFGKTNFMDTCGIDDYGVKHIYDEHMSGRRNHGYVLWNLIVLSLFLERCND